MSGITDGAKAPRDFQLERPPSPFTQAPVLGLTPTGHLTSVIEHGVDERAVAEECVAGRDVFKVTLLKQGILEGH